MNSTNSHRKYNTSKHSSNNGLSKNGPVVKASEFSFEQTYLLKYLTCSACNQVFRNPMRLHPCGHIFCNQCATPQNCATCRASVIDIQVDLIAHNLVSDLQVLCKAKGCPFRGSYQQYLRNHKDKCQISRCGGLQAWMQQMRRLACQTARTQEVIVVQGESTVHGQQVQKKQRNNKGKQYSVQDLCQNSIVECQLDILQQLCVSQHQKPHFIECLSALKTQQNQNKQSQQRISNCNQVQTRRLINRKGKSNQSKQKVVNRMINVTRKNKIDYAISDMPDITYKQRLKRPQQSHKHTADTQKFVASYFRSKRNGKRNRLFNLVVKKDVIQL